jgi:hypothetical protein
MSQSKFTIEFRNKSNAWPHSWMVNHGGPLEDAKIAAFSAMKQETFPAATRFTIHDNETKVEVFESNA